jgi:hypothetical protein
MRFSENAIVNFHTPINTNGQLFLHELILNAEMVTENSADTTFSRMLHFWCSWNGGAARGRRQA